MAKRKGCAVVEFPRQQREPREQYLARRIEYLVGTQAELTALLSKAAQELRERGRLEERKPEKAG